MLENKNTSDDIRINIYNKKYHDSIEKEKLEKQKIQQERKALLQKEANEINDFFNNKEALKLCKDFVSRYAEKGRDCEYIGCWSSYVGLDDLFHEASIDRSQKYALDHRERILKHLYELKKDLWKEGIYMRYGNFHYPDCMSVEFFWDDEISELYKEGRSLNDAFDLIQLRIDVQEKNKRKQKISDILCYVLMAVVIFGFIGILIMTLPGKKKL